MPSFVEAFLCIVDPRLSSRLTFHAVHSAAGASTAADEEDGDGMLCACERERARWMSLLFSDPKQSSLLWANRACLCGARATGAARVAGRLPC